MNPLESLADPKRQSKANTIHDGRSLGIYGLVNTSRTYCVTAR